MSISQIISSEKHILDVSNFSIRKFSVWRCTELLVKTKRKICDKNKDDVLCFEISSDKMKFLLSNHQICAADIRCLDVNSKHRLKKLCLQACLHNISSTRQISTEK